MGHKESMKAKTSEITESGEGRVTLWAKINSHLGPVPL